MSVINTLSNLGMKEKKGLVLTTKPHDAINDAERLALVEAKRFKADAVYFRRFDNDLHSIPQIYLYEKEVSDEELVEIHTNLWSSGVVPLFYIVTKTEIKIFNCTKSVVIDPKKKKNKPTSEPIKTLKLINEVQTELEYQKFSSRLFDGGVFWEENSALIKAADSPYQKLLEGLLSAKKYLMRKLKENKLSSSTISKLLVMGILIKYLEEKEDDKGVKLLEISRDFYRQFPHATQFTDILRNGQVVHFFELLNRKFNGKVFDLKQHEKAELAQANLEYVAAVFDANIETKNSQYVIWKLYAFNFLPIELISGIYEAFLTKEEIAGKKKKSKGVVYTPPYLVNLLIDECMPLYKAEEYFTEGTFKVLDPACGSGIFLVAALKRMVQWQAILHYKATEEICFPPIETIKTIARTNIFGIDVEEDATLISIFSLCIALCDKLSPMQIWNDLQFDDLQAENIKTPKRGGFFEIYPTLKNQEFDLIIGNPPFNPSDNYTNKSYLKFIKDEFQLSPNFLINDDNLALFFWDKATELRKIGGKICFVLPAGAWLYNNHSMDYRRYFMEKYQVEKIYDFTHLSDKLFHGSTTVAVCATIATDKMEDKNADLLHIVVKRSKMAEERFFFEIDHYDFHKVKYRLAIENPFVWKCNLLGGGRLLRLINYLAEMRSLGEFLEEKEKEGWVSGEGYIIGHDGTKSEEELLSKGFSKAKWITDKNTIDTNSFTEFGFEVKEEKEPVFLRPRKTKKKIFQPPHILIKEELGENGVPIAFSEDFLCFTSRIIGIHAPISSIEELRILYNTLMTSKDLYKFHLFCSSSQAGITMSNSLLMKKEILGIPYPKNLESLELSNSEQALQYDVLNYYLSANISNANSPLNQEVVKPDLIEYGSLFCDILNPIYAKNGMKWFVRGFEISESLIIYAFCYGVEKDNILLNLFADGLDGIEKLIYNQTQRNVHITRVLRQYVHIEGYDIVLLIKPKFSRYWLKSVALRDADETFLDLKMNGF